MNRNIHVLTDIYQAANFVSTVPLRRWWLYVMYVAMVVVSVYHLGDKLEVSGVDMASHSLWYNK